MAVRLSAFLAVHGVSCLRCCQIRVHLRTVLFYDETLGTMGYCSGLVVGKNIIGSFVRIIEVSNIMLKSSDLDVCLVDFGLCGLYNAPRKRNTEIVGTPGSQLFSLEEKRRNEEVH